jgi:hypothetical protein
MSSYVCSLAEFFSINGYSLAAFLVDWRIYGLVSGNINNAIRDKVGHLETSSRALLNAHLDPSFIFNHLDTMNAGPNYSS